MSLFTRNFRYWIPVLLWLAVIALESFKLSSSVTGVWLRHSLQWFHFRISARGFEELHHVLRKLGHVTGYGVLCLLMFRAWFHTLSSRSRLRCASLALLLTLVTASLDEWHQSFDPGRTSSLSDVGLDLIGGILFLVVALFVFHAWKKSAAAVLASA